MSFVEMQWFLGFELKPIEKITSYILSVDCPNRVMGMSSDCWDSLIRCGFLFVYSWCDTLLQEYIDHTTNPIESYIIVIICWIFNFVYKYYDMQMYSNEKECHPKHTTSTHTHTLISHQSEQSVFFWILYPVDIVVGICVKYILMFVFSLELWLSESASQSASIDSHLYK